MGFITKSPKHSKINMLEFYLDYVGFIGKGLDELQAGWIAMSGGRQDDRIHHWA